MNCIVSNTRMARLQGSHLEVRHCTYSLDFEGLDNVTTHMFIRLCSSHPAIVTTYTNVATTFVGFGLNRDENQNEQAPPTANRIQNMKPKAREPVLKCVNYDS